ncbi:MAG: hypothetical protein AAFY56_09435 [Pseudomonadota bacterium]
MKIAGTFAVLLLLATSVAAQDFSADSQASSWGLVGEEKGRFDAQVVDILCELTGDCPDNCGDGRRQLGLVRAADEKLIIVNKNGQPLFNGAVPDLLPYCGQTIGVDGLFVGEEGSKLYQVQLVRPEDGEWTKTERWLEVWNEQNPALADQEGQWFRKDPRIEALIEENGYLGLGQEADAKFIEDWF